jgi:hypothetical protein
LTNTLKANVYKICQSQGQSSNLIGTGSPVTITDGSSVNLYTFSTAVPTTQFAIDDRMAVSFIGVSTSTNTICLSTEGNTLAAVATTIPTGIASLNGLTPSSQFFCSTTLGTDFNIISTCCTHCFNLPTASESNRGALSTCDWNTFNSKQCGSYPANSFFVNPTAISATATCGLYCCTGELSITGTGGSFSYTSTLGTGTFTAPTGGIQTYRWMKMGNMVTLQVNLNYTTGGIITGTATFTGIEVKLPSSLPVPDVVSGYTAVSNVISVGSTVSNVGANIGGGVTKGAFTISSSSTTAYSFCFLAATTFGNATGTCKNFVGNVVYLAASIT